MAINYGKLAKSLHDRYLCGSPYVVLTKKNYLTKKLPHSLEALEAETHSIDIIFDLRDNEVLATLMTVVALHVGLRLKKLVQIRQSSPVATTGQCLVRKELVQPHHVMSSSCMPANFLEQFKITLCNYTNSNFQLSRAQ